MGLSLRTRRPYKLTAPSTQPQKFTGVSNSRLMVTAIFLQLKWMRATVPKQLSLLYVYEDCAPAFRVYSVFAKVVALTCGYKDFCRFPRAPQPGPQGQRCLKFRGQATF